MRRALAFGAQSLARTSVALLSEEEERYRLLARNMSDVISRHVRNGAVHVHFARGRSAARRADRRA